MKILVTKKDRKYTNDIPLLRTEGEIAEIDMLALYKHVGGETISDVLKRAYVGYDVLVYFPHLDFCYWLAKDEYEIVED